MATTVQQPALTYTTPVALPATFAPMPAGFHRSSRRAFSSWLRVAKPPVELRFLGVFHGMMDSTDMSSSSSTCNVDTVCEPWLVAGLPVDLGAEVREGLEALERLDSMEAEPDICTRAHTACLLAQDGTHSAADIAARFVFWVVYPTCRVRDLADARAEMADALAALLLLRPVSWRSRLRDVDMIAGYSCCVCWVCCACCDVPLFSHPGRLLFHSPHP